MSSSHLRDELENLRREAEGLAEDQTDIRERIHRLINEIERHTENTDAADHGKILKKVRDDITEFEVEHPRLTSVLNRVMMALSSMGI